MKTALDANAMLAVALDQAHIGLAEGGIPVGGAIFRFDGTLVSAGRNRLVQNGDPSMHGETDASRRRPQPNFPRFDFGDALSLRAGTARD